MTGLSGVSDPQDSGRAEVIWTARRSMWLNLPALCVGSLAAGLVLLVGALAWAVTPLLGAAVLVAGAPLWMGLTLAAERTLEREDVSIRDLVSSVRRRRGDAVRTAAVPATCAAAFVYGLAGYRIAPAPWLVGFLGVGGSVLLVVLVGSVHAFSLRDATGARGARLWLAAATVGFVRPVPTLAVAAAAALLALATTSWSASVLMVVPGLMALMCAVASRHARATLRLLHDGASRDTR